MTKRTDWRCCYFSYRRSVQWAVS